MRIFGNTEFMMLKKFYEPFLDYKVEIHQIKDNFVRIIGNKVIESEIITLGKGIPIYIPKEMFKNENKIKEVCGFGFYHLYEIIKGNVVISKNKVCLKIPVFVYEKESERDFLILYFSIYKRMRKKLVSGWKKSLKIFSSYKVKRELENFFSNL